MQKTLKDGKEKDGKEVMERHEVAEKQGAEGERKEGRKMEEKDSGGLERKREEENSLMESGVLGEELWSGVRRGERGGCKERAKSLEERRQRIRRIKDRRGEERRFGRIMRRKRRRGLGMQ